MGGPPADRRTLSLFPILIQSRNSRPMQYAAFLWLLLETITITNIMPPSFKPDQEIECIVDTDLSEAIDRTHRASMDEERRVLIANALPCRVRYRVGTRPCIPPFVKIPPSLVYMFERYILEVKSTIGQKTPRWSGTHVDEEKRQPGV